jgi:hypothetical protein
MQRMPIHLGSDEKPLLPPKEEEHEDSIVKAEHVDHASMFVPKHSSYCSVTSGLAGHASALHSAGGVIVFSFLLLGTRVLRKLLPAQSRASAQRSGVAGLFSALVDSGV